MANLLIVKASIAVLIAFTQVSIVVLISFIYRRYIRKIAALGLPPGPKPLPVLGNITDLPPKGVPEFRHWLKHKEVYGPISSVTVMGQTLVIVHDKEAAHDLLEKNSITSSQRPTTEFANNLCGFGEFLPSQQYDDNFRRGRKFVHQQLGTKAAVTRFNDVQEVEVRRFLLRVLNQPETLAEHLKTMSGAIILKMTYGYSIGTNEADPLVDMIGQMMANFSLAAVPMAWLVDIFPALQYLPDGFPGTSFKETARRWKKVTQAAVDIPYSFVRQQMTTHRYQPSYVSNLVQQCSKDSAEKRLSHDDERTIKWTAAIMYAGGTDTTAATLSSFILAMILFPEVQRTAQEEIDRVIGNDRLPRFEDRDKLPYIEGVVKEAFRWSPVGSLAFPHVMSENTTYSGYLIPKGAAIIPSAWWFLHDPDVYVDESIFNPERYLEPRSEPDPKSEAFGYGRRICPGRYLADASVFLAVAQILAAFNISKAVDEQGVEKEAKLEVIPGMISRPVDFPYKIVPRSVGSAHLVRSIESEKPLEESDAGFLKAAQVTVNQ